MVRQDLYASQTNLGLLEGLFFIYSDGEPCSRWPSLETTAHHGHEQRSSRKELEGPQLMREGCERGASLTSICLARVEEWIE
jgi:hypothetical protein